MNKNQPAKSYKQACRLTDLANQLKLILNYLDLVNALNVANSDGLNEYVSYFLRGGHLESLADNIQQIQEQIQQVSDELISDD